MTLLDTMKVPCVMMDRVTVPDGYGSWDYQWTDGAEFEAVIRKDETPTDMIAEKKDANEHYTIIVDSNVHLYFNDVVKRVEDGQMFKITSSTTDKTAPSRSTVKISVAQAERWVPS